MSEGEDLQSNPFFSYLLAKLPVDRIVERNLIVCVPAAGSLTRLKIDNDLVLAHLLAPTAVKDVYATQIRGQTVIVTSDSITTREGFSYNRTVPVLSQETFYDDNFRSFQILHLAYPIVGAVSASYVRSLQPQELCVTPLVQRSLGEHVEVLTTILGTKGMRDLSAARHRFTKEFLLSYVMVKGFEAETSEKISEFSTALTNEFLKRSLEPSIERCQIAPSSARGSVNGWCPAAQVEFTIALDCILAYELNQLVFGALTNFFEAEDAIITARANALKQYSLSDQYALLHVREDLRCSVSESAAYLRRMNDVHTPFQKMAYVNDAINAIFTSVNAHVKQARVRRRSVAASSGDPNLSATASSSYATGGTSIIANAAAAAAAASGAVAEVLGVNGTTPFHEVEKASSQSDTASDEGTEAIATDDILPLLTLAVLQAHSGHSFATLQYIKHFKPKLSMENSSYQQLEAAFASFSASVVYVLSDKFPLTHGVISNSNPATGANRRRGSNAFSAAQISAAATASAGHSAGFAGASYTTPVPTSSLPTHSGTVHSSLLSSLGVSPNLLDSDDEDSTLPPKDDKKDEKKLGNISSAYAGFPTNSELPSGSRRYPSLQHQQPQQVSLQQPQSTQQLTLGIPTTPANARTPVARGNASPGTLLSALEFEQEQLLVDSILRGTNPSGAQLSIKPPPSTTSATQPLSDVGTGTGSQVNRWSNSTTSYEPPSTSSGATSHVVSDAPSPPASGRIDYGDISRRIGISMSTSSAHTQRVSQPPTPQNDASTTNSQSIRSSQPLVDDDEEISGFKDLLSQLMLGSGGTVVQGRLK